MKIAILGVRGVPASHGGFETFAERLALHLVAAGHDVVVYCQGSSNGLTETDAWNGIRRVHVPTRLIGAAGTIEFDWKSVGHAVAFPPDAALVLGYNTALFCARLRLQGIPVAINMDGIEWRRAKWGFIAKAWFLANELLACVLGQCLIADHPEIAKHLLRHRTAIGKVVVIPYGGDDLGSHVPDEAFSKQSLPPGTWLSIVARPEPENSILEMVTAFSKRRRNAKLLVLGSFDPDRNAYHRQVMDAAGGEVVFAGAIYDAPTLRAIRRGSTAYLHGHTVGGTNPSLVEALGASSAVIAHDNKYNRWVAGEGALYFTGVDDLDSHISRLLGDTSTVEQLQRASFARFLERFQWEGILTRYVEVLSRLSQRMEQTESSRRR